MNFQDLNTTKIGNTGEKLIIKEFSESTKSKLFVPATVESFPIDSIAIKDYKVYGIEIKTKPRMKYYEETGMDTADHKSYLKMPFPVYVLFIDYVSECIYGQWISKLDKQKREIKNVTLYPLSMMKKYRDLTSKEIEMLKSGCFSKYYDL